MPGFGSDNFALNPHFFGSAGQTIASLQNFTNPELAGTDPEKLGSAVTQLTNAYVAADISDARGLFESLRRGTIRPEEAREELIKITEGLQDSKTWERIKGALKRQSVRFRPVGQIVKDLKLNKDRMEFIESGNRNYVGASASQTSGSGKASLMRRPIMGSELVSMAQANFEEISADLVTIKGGPL